MYRYIDEEGMKYHIQVGNTKSYITQLEDVENINLKKGNDVYVAKEQITGIDVYIWDDSDEFNIVKNIINSRDSFNNKKLKVENIIKSIVFEKLSLDDKVKLISDVVKKTKNSSYRSGYMDTQLRIRRSLGIG